LGYYFKLQTLKTLDRVLSKAGLGSRTEARKWIGAGRVQVNGKVIQTPDHWVDPGKDEVTLDGKTVRAAEKVYLLLYKPKGFLTTYKDPEGRPTVYALMEELGQHVVPVGRLDLDTSGLLILTNDTLFAERIMNPEFKVPKTYMVKAAGVLEEEQMERLRSGVELEDGCTRPAVVTRLRDRENSTFLEITITEGRNRQVRRMLEAVGSKVRKLVRTAIGPVRIGKLEIGKWRVLEREEVNALAGKDWFKRAKADDRPRTPRKPVPGGGGIRDGRGPQKRRSGGGTGRGDGSKGGSRGRERSGGRPRAKK
jgi:23S rRNA pseudouridine2605 synthase